MKMKVKRKQAVMLGLIAVFAVLLAITMLTGKPSADGEYTSVVYATALSLLPPVIAIGLALFTKEVYTSLLAGILAGALLYANGNLELMLNTMLFNEDGGMVSKLSDSGNVGILVFLVMLGILVSLLNKAGGSAAFGKWASKHIKTRIGAQISVMILGVLIFIDDYFNCQTVTRYPEQSYLILLMRQRLRFVSLHQSAPGQPQLRHLFQPILELMVLRSLFRPFHTICMQF